MLMRWSLSLGGSSCGETKSLRTPPTSEPMLEEVEQVLSLVLTVGIEIDTKNYAIGKLELERHNLLDEMSIGLKSITGKGYSHSTSI